MKLEHADAVFSLAELTTLHVHDGEESPPSLMFLQPGKFESYDWISRELCGQVMPVTPTPGVARRGPSHRSVLTLSSAAEVTGSVSAEDIVAHGKTFSYPRPNPACRQCHHETAPETFFFADDGSHPEAATCLRASPISPDHQRSAIDSYQDKLF